ncbi:MAG: amylo-alpha-1,6-glucosidase [Candidatus Dormibacteraceae bacterium]
MRFGREVCGSLEAASAREWLVTDGLGGYAMGTVGGLRTRRYHGLLVVATRPPGNRMLALADLDAILVVGERRIPLAVHEWASGAIDPTGHIHLESFTLEDGLPRWRWAVGDVVVERTVAMASGRAAVAIIHRVVRAPRAVDLELHPLCTWRDVNGERFAGAAPAVETTALGFVFEGAYQVAAPGFAPDGAWYRDVRYRVEAARGLNDREDLWHPGRFTVRLQAGETHQLVAWAAPVDEAPPPAAAIVRRSGERAKAIVAASGSDDEAGRLLAQAADQFIVSGPTVVAGYPWFGDWSRDTMTSYEGLFLELGRSEEGRQLLLRMAGTLSEGMLANTADIGGTEYNTADATLWFLHAVGRHIERTNDQDLAAQLSGSLREVIAHHIAGTRYGIKVDPADSLLRQGTDGLALTWMDARIDGRPVTQRAGKAVEINALWINGLATVAGLEEGLGRDASRLRTFEQRARDSFLQRFVRPAGCADVVDPDNMQVRPNCLLALSLPHGPLVNPDIVRAVAPELLTSVGLRSLAPSDPAYIGRHRGGPRERDAAYHQGTVWPWLIGAYVEAAVKGRVPLEGVLEGLEQHIYEWGLGSVSETADGDPPHDATGCPMQAWSVAELIRARNLLRRQ